MSTAGDPGPELPGGLFLGIDHVGYAVADLDAALALHARLGWRPVHRERNEEQGVEEVLLAPAPLLDGGPGTDAEADPSARVQLLAALSTDSPLGRYLERSGPGIQQVAYRVGDLEAVSAVLRERGFRLVHPSSRRGTGGTRINFIHPRDTGGVLIELVQPVAD